MYYYGARYYDPRISIFISVDPLAEIYRGIGGYAYVANNPINFIGPEGRYIRVWYKTGVDSNGKTIGKYWDFNGRNASSAPHNQFVQDFLEAYNYNLKNGGGDNLKKAAFDSYRYELFEIEPMVSMSSSNLNGRNIITWNPLTGPCASILLVPQ